MWLTSQLCRGVQLCRPLRSGLSLGARRVGALQCPPYTQRAAAPDTGGAQALHPGQATQKPGARRSQGGTGEPRSENAIPRTPHSSSRTALGAGTSCKLKSLQIQNTCKRSKKPCAQLPRASKGLRAPAPQVGAGSTQESAYGNVRQRHPPVGLDALLHFPAVLPAGPVGRGSIPVRETLA